MQKLIKLARQLKKQRLPEQLQVNYIREYLQVIILKAIYHSKYAGSLSFMGGTALRICYDLKRFSEDLDFELDRNKREYSFPALMDAISKDLDSQGYAVEIGTTGGNTVNRAFVRLSKILYPLGLTHRESHKIHIKIEVDTDPVKVKGGQVESYFVTKFDEIFPIKKHKIETLFAGKISAILGREFAKGRDYYDLIWYLTRKTEIDMSYLNASVKRNGLSPFKNRNKVFERLSDVVAKTRPEIIMKDIARFLEDPGEAEWIKNYQDVFKQLALITA